MDLTYRQPKVNAEQPQETLSMHPKKFILWLFIVSIVMIFAALTSAYIVRQGEGNWFVFELPAALWLTTAVLALSSVTMQWAHYSAKRDNIANLRIAIILTAALGMAFLVGQLYVWEGLKSMNVIFQGNPSGSFLYVLTGVHGFHLVTGIIFILIVSIQAFRYKIHSKKMVQIDMCATYWHFLDGLWIYLFIFLLMNH
jgi:cytochrome c oxidase subunit 3